MEQRARLLVAFADGFEESGLTMTARRMRVVARDLVELVGVVRAYQRNERERNPVDGETAPLLAWNGATDVDDVPF